MWGVGTYPSLPISGAPPATDGHQALRRAATDETPRKAGPQTSRQKPRVTRGSFTSQATSSSASSGLSSSKKPGIKHSKKYSKLNHGPFKLTIIWPTSIRIGAKVLRRKIIKKDKKKCFKDQTLGFKIGQIFLGKNKHTVSAPCGRCLRSLAARNGARGSPKGKARSRGGSCRRAVRRLGRTPVAGVETKSG